MDTAAAGRFGREIRDHVKALPDGKRTGFVTAAIDRGILMLPLPCFRLRHI